MNPVESTLIEKDGLKLWVDPVALAALEAARAAGGRTDHGALPSFDELPLRLLALEMRVEALEAADG